MTIDGVIRGYLDGILLKHELFNWMVRLATPENVGSIISAFPAEEYGEFVDWIAHSDGDVVEIVPVEPTAAEAQAWAAGLDALRTHLLRRR